MSLPLQEASTDQPRSTPPPLRPPGWTIRPDLLKIHNNIQPLGDGAGKWMPLTHYPTTA